MLDLGANRLTILPPCVLRLRSLLVLKLDRQRLKQLPPELSLLPGLSELDAGFNELETALPARGAQPAKPSPARAALQRPVERRGKLDPDALPRLTELDLSGNALVTWPDDLGKLDGLNRLLLANNRLTTLVSSSTVAHKRMWVPSAGIHTLEQLIELSLAQNALSELPTALNHLRALRRLDVRCNPLSSPSLNLAKSHCAACNATLLASAISRAAPGLLLGDDSSAWHKPTLLRSHVKRILSVGGPPPDGVPAAKLSSKLPDEFRKLGLWVTGPPGEPEPPPGGPGYIITVEVLRRAFHSAALRLHPDKQPEGADTAAAAEAFNELQQAYRALGRAVAIEQRRLPQLDGFMYAFVDLPQESEDGGSGSSSGGSDNLAATFRQQLPAMLAFAREGRGSAAEGELLVHPAGGGTSHSFAICVLLAILIDEPDSNPSLQSAATALAKSLKYPSSSVLLSELPKALIDELTALASEALRSRLRIERADDAVVSAEDVRRDTSGRYDPVLSMDDPFAPRGAATAPQEDIYEFPKREKSKANRKPYEPTLSMSGPYGLDTSFEGLNVSEPPQESAEGFVPAPNGFDGPRKGMVFKSGSAGLGYYADHIKAEAPSVSTFDIGGGSTFDIGDDEPKRPTWSVDDEGRKVLRNPHRNVYSVTIEYEEGARGDGANSRSIGS